MANPYVDHGELSDLPPMDESQAPPSPNTSVRHKRADRSCLLCHQRKIRCDKRSPCANCARADILCCYPGPERSGRRLPKSTIADVAARVTRLERTINAISKDASHTDSNLYPISDSKFPPGEGNISETLVPRDCPGEILVQDGLSTRYVNETILSRVLEEERELLSVMGSPSGHCNLIEKPASFDIRGIFSGFNQFMTDTRSYYPSRWHAMQLWQAFVTNVDPIAKILHIPTTQATVYAAINSPQNLEAGLDALLFSIYFAATTSLTSAAVASLLGQDKSIALNKYKQGLEQSLAAANILDTPSIRSLQAMTIYLTCLRAYSGDRAVWTLTGLAIRSAQSIGLHRDGTNFKLSPFESEMRRRLWGYLCAIDSRAAEDHGIALSTSDGDSDTRLPVNVDDNEISPDAQEMPVGKAKWTDVSFSLTMIEISRVLSQLYRTPDASSPGSVSSGSPSNQMLIDLTTRLEAVYLKYCDSNIPIQNATLLCANLMMAKLKFLVSHPWLNRHGDEQGEAQANDDTLAAACHILEINLQLQTEDLLRGFRWYFETYTQNHILTYLLWHLRMKPVGPGVDRAWRSIDESFEVADHRNISCEPGSRWKVLQLLKEKAMRIRQSCNTESNTMESQPREPAVMNILTEGGEGPPDLTLDASFWDFTATNFDMVRGFEGGYFPNYST